MFWDSRKIKNKTWKKTGKKKKRSKGEKENEMTGFVGICRDDPSSNESSRIETCPHRGPRPIGPDAQTAPPSHLHLISISSNEKDAIHLHRCVKTRLPGCKKIQSMKNQTRLLDALLDADQLDILISPASKFLRLSISI